MGTSLLLVGHFAFLCLGLPIGILGIVTTSQGKYSGLDSTAETPFCVTYNAHLAGMPQEQTTL